MPTVIEQQFIDLHPGSRFRHEPAKEKDPRGVTHDARRQHPFQLYYTHANGPHKYDVDGNKIIDFWMMVKNGLMGALIRSQIPLNHFMNPYH